MSEVIRRLLQAVDPIPNSEWVASSLPHKPPMDESQVMVEGVPPLPMGGVPGRGYGRSLYDPSRQPPMIELPGPYRRPGIFRSDNPDSIYDDNTT